jgi:hypothetical protein
MVDGMSPSVRLGQIVSLFPVYMERRNVGDICRIFRVCGGLRGGHWNVERLVLDGFKAPFLPNGSL